MNVTSTMIVLLLIGISVITPATLAAQDIVSNFDSRVDKILEKLNKLKKLNYNVSEYVDDLNSAIKYMENGDQDRAYDILNNVEISIDSIWDSAKQEYKYYIFKKYIQVGTLLAIPIVVYYCLSRCYLYLWYRSRRDWTVEE